MKLRKMPHEVHDEEPPRNYVYAHLICFSNYFVERNAILSERVIEVHQHLQISLIYMLYLVCLYQSRSYRIYQ